MGVLQSKKQKEKHPVNKDITNGNAKEAATDLNQSNGNALTGNPSNTANTGQGLSPAQLISHQMEPGDGNEAMLTTMHQVPDVDAPQNREQNTHKAVSTSQNADPVKYNHFLVSAVKMTEQHTSPAKPKAKLQQATPARPTAEPGRGVKPTAGEFYFLKSDAVQQLQDVPEKIRPSAPEKPVQHQKRTTAPVQQRANTHFTPSQQRPAAKENTEVPLLTVRSVAPCDMGTRATADLVATSVQLAAQVPCKGTSHLVECSFGSKKQQVMSAQLPASQVQAPVCQKSKEQSATTKPGIAEVPATKPTEPTNQHIVEEPVTTMQKRETTCIQKVSVKVLAPQVPVVEGMPTAAPNNGATHNPKTAAAEISVKLRLKSELEVTLPKNATVKRKKKNKVKTLNQGQFKSDARNVTMKEDIDGKNSQVEDKEQEPGINPAVPPEQNAHTEGRWHPFTVNQSCPRKVCGPRPRDRAATRCPRGLMNAQMK